MASRRIGYFLTLVILFFTLTLYDFAGLRLLFGFLLLLPVMGMAQLMCSVPFVKVSFTRDSYQCLRGEDAEVELLFQNRGWLPLSRVRIKLLGQRQDLWGIDGREKRWFVMPFATEHCGSMQCRMEWVRIYDYLGLCSLRKRSMRAGRRKAQAVRLYVLPRAEELDAEILSGALQAEQRLLWGAEEGDAYEYRDYREGDSLHRVHWKLSARMEELQIRESLGQAQRGTLLLWKTSTMTADQKERADIDAYLERSLAMMEFLYQEELLERVCWYEGGRLVAQELTRAEDIRAVLLQLLTPTLEEDPGRGMFPLKGADPGGKGSYMGDMTPPLGKTDLERLQREPGWLYLSRDRKLYRGDRCLYE